MKVHVEIGHLTKYDAYRVNREQVMDLNPFTAKGSPFDE